MKQLGWPELRDNNTLDDINGSMRALRYVNPDGKREDVAHAYIHPKLQSGKFPNLHVLVETDVERILFDDNKKAVGVTFRPNPDFQPGTEQGPLKTVKARKQVVLSAGALGTPLILERSGVGSPEVLARAGVPLVAPVPGVGENYIVSGLLFLYFPPHSQCFDHTLRSNYGLLGASMGHQEQNSQYLPRS